MGKKLRTRGKSPVALAGCLPLRLLLLGAGLLGPASVLLMVQGRDGIGAGDHSRRMIESLLLLLLILGYFKIALTKVTKCCWAVGVRFARVNLSFL